MFVTYTPDGADRHEWEFIPGKMRASEAQPIERRFGGSWEKWSIEIQQGSVAARRLLLWHLLRREHPTLRWEDTPDYAMDELEISYSSDEMRDLITNAEAAPIEDQEQKNAVLAGLRAELEKAEQRERDQDEARGDTGTVDDDAEGKAPQPTG